MDQTNLLQKAYIIYKMRENWVRENNASRSFFFRNK